MLAYSNHEPTNIAFTKTSNCTGIVGHQNVAAAVNLPSLQTYTLPYTTHHINATIRVTHTYIHTHYVNVLTPQLARIPHRNHHNLPKTTIPSSRTRPAVPPAASATAPADAGLRPAPSAGPGSVRSCAAPGATAPGRPGRPGGCRPG